MKYPFEFRELLITDKVLDKLGFNEYWAGCGDFGDRRFGIKKNENQFEFIPHIIIETDEMDDPECGYGYGAPWYSSQRWHSNFNAPHYRDIYFLHDLYEDIRENSPYLLDHFINKTKERGVNMYPYIEQYLQYMESSK